MTTTRESLLTYIAAHGVEVVSTTPQSVTVRRAYRCAGAPAVEQQTLPFTLAAIRGWLSRVAWDRGES